MQFKANPPRFHSFPVAKKSNRFWLPSMEIPNVQVYSSGVTFTFVRCLNLASKGYNCFCKVITTRLASDSFACFANCASFLQHCHTVAVHCGLMRIIQTGSSLADTNAH